MLNKCSSGRFENVFGLMIVIIQTYKSSCEFISLIWHPFSDGTNEMGMHSCDRKNLIGWNIRNVSFLGELFKSTWVVWLWISKLYYELFIGWHSFERRISIPTTKWEWKWIVTKNEYSWWIFSVPEVCILMNLQNWLIFTSMVNFKIRKLFHHFQKLHASQLKESAPNDLVLVKKNCFKTINI